MMIKKMLQAGVLGGVLLSTSTLVSASCGDSDYVGSICMTAANYCPYGTLEANGQVLNIQQYAALYSLLGNVYGGDGVTNFKLPDLRGRTTVGQGQGPGLQPVAMGQYRGADFLALTQANLPAHTHSATFSPTGGAATQIQASTGSGQRQVPQNGDYLAAGNALAANAAQIYSDTLTSPVTLGGVTGGGGSGSVSVGVTGIGTAFPNFPPQVGIRYCVVDIGIYPSHP